MHYVAVLLPSAMLENCWSAVCTVGSGSSSSSPGSPLLLSPSEFRSDVNQAVNAHKIAKKIPEAIHTLLVDIDSYSGDTDKN